MWKSLIRKLILLVAKTSVNRQKHMLYLMEDWWGNEIVISWKYYWRCFPYPFVMNKMMKVAENGNSKHQYADEEGYTARHLSMK